MNVSVTVDTSRCGKESGWLKSMALDPIKEGNCGLPMISDIGPNMPTGDTQANGTCAGE